MITPHTAITLLIADDDQYARKALDCILLRKFPGAIIHTAGDGRTALEYYRKYLPDIVITDIIMPELNGKQLAQEIRAIKADAKLIAITGISDLEDSNDSAAPDMLFDHAIVKPVVFGELFAAIEQCFAEISGNKEPKADG
jgi:YesN/AraC family two-component response regulator